MFVLWFLKISRVVRFLPDVILVTLLYDDASLKERLQPSTVGWFDNCLLFFKNPSVNVLLRDQTLWLKSATVQTSFRWYTVQDSPQNFAHMSQACLQCWQLYCMRPSLQHLTVNGVESGDGIVKCCPFIPEWQFVPQEVKRISLHQVRH